MLRSLAKRAPQDTPVLAAGSVRQYFAPLSVEFSEDVTGSAKAAKGAPPLLKEWANSKEATLESMKLLQTYKDVGDAKDEPLLKFHDPKTFEDLDAPIPNFRRAALTAGQVPKFFDAVLAKRADTAVATKDAWWAARQSEAAAAAAGKEFGTFPTVPVPKWEWAKPVTLDALQGVTDQLFVTLEPKRKLKLPAFPAQVEDALSGYTSSLGQPGAVAELRNVILQKLAEKAVVEEGGKVLEGFTYLTKAEAAKKLAAKRTEVHNRWLKQWAKVVFTTPEQALVPLKERDSLLASKFADVDPKYNDLVSAVTFGTSSYGQRLAASEETNNFFIRDDKAKILADNPSSPEELEALELARKLEDKSYALDRLLGPLLHAEGTKDQLKSEELAEVTEFLYTPDRYLYKEAQSLVQRYKEEEAELLEKLRPLYGDAVDVKDFQRNPRSPVQQLFQRLREVALFQAALAKDKAAAKGHPYLLYALDKQSSFYSDPSNTPFEEVLYPSITEELYQIELADLEAKERQVDEAEEEELWLLTLLRQARHIHQNIEFDLPQAAVAHMDPLLYKKLDWELTHGADLLHHEVSEAADSPQGQYLKDQYGLENLSHHFLPLIRYRRKKSRAQLGYFPAETTPLPVASQTA